MCRLIIFSLFYFLTSLTCYADVKSTNKPVMTLKELTDSCRIEVFPQCLYVAGFYLNVDGAAEGLANDPTKLINFTVKEENKKLAEEYSVQFLNDLCFMTGKYKGTTIKQIIESRKELGEFKEKSKNMDKKSESYLNLISELLFKGAVLPETIISSCTTLANFYSLKNNYNEMKKVGSYLCLPNELIDRNNSIFFNEKMKNAVKSGCKVHSRAIFFSEIYPKCGTNLGKCKGKELKRLLQKGIPSLHTGCEFGDDNACDLYHDVMKIIDLKNRK